MAAAVQIDAVHRHDLRADAAGQGGRSAAGIDAGRFRLRGPHEPRSPLPRRARRRRDGAAQLRAAERTADLGYVQSHRARAKVRQWFKAQQLEATIAQGREMVERELHRAGKTALKLDAVAAQAGFD